MSGYHCVDYCQNERERCCRNEKDTRQSSCSTSSSRIYTASPSLSLSLSSMELEYSSAPQSYKKPQLLLSDPSPYIVSSGGAEIVMSSITSLCPGSVDTLTNSITQTIEIDAAAETHRRLWTQQSRPTPSLHASSRAAVTDKWRSSDQEGAGRNNKKKKQNL